MPVYETARRPDGRYRNHLPSRLLLPKKGARLAYLAGMIDADGCVFLKYYSKGVEHRMIPRVDVVDTDLELMSMLEAIGGIVRPVAPNALSKKPIFVWTVSRTTEVLALLRAVVPYMIVKRAKAREVIAILQSRIRPELQRVT